jgi:mannose-6-phosphate isomerase-like protein (cupin superfamily)
MKAAIRVIASQVTAILSLAVGAAAQSGQTAQPTYEVNRHPVPLSALVPQDGAKPNVLLQDDVKARLDALVPAAKATGASGATLVDYGSYKLQLSVRTASGGAEVHAHWDDVMMVEAGSATLLTGGAVVGGSTDENGETHGQKIDGGQTQTLSAGDMITVRAGTPHQILLTAGTVYEAVVVKVHEP